jgi:hypothetical protein
VEYKNRTIYLVLLVFSVPQLGPLNPIAWEDGPSDQTKCIPTVVNGKCFWIPKFPPEGRVRDRLNERWVEGLNRRWTSTGRLVAGKKEDVGQNGYPKGDRKRSRRTKEFVGRRFRIEGGMMGHDEKEQLA